MLSPRWPSAAVGKRTWKLERNPFGPKTVLVIDGDLRCPGLDESFGVNLTFLPAVTPPDYPGYIDAIVKGGVKIVEPAIDRHRSVHPDGANRRPSVPVPRDHRGRDGRRRILMIGGGLGLKRNGRANDQQ